MTAELPPTTFLFLFRSSLKFANKSSRYHGEVIMSPVLYRPCPGTIFYFEPSLLKLHFISKNPLSWTTYQATFHLKLPFIPKKTSFSQATLYLKLSLSRTFLSFSSPRSLEPFEILEKIVGLNQGPTTQGLSIPFNCLAKNKLKRT